MGNSHPMKIGIPPNVGLGLWLKALKNGLSIKFHFSAILMVKGSNKKVIMNETPPINNKSEIALFAPCTLEDNVFKSF